MARATTGLSYLTFGLVILGSLVFTVFVTVPQWGAYMDANKKYADAMQLEVERQAFLDNLDARLNDMKKYDKESKELSLALPDKFVQSNIWVNIEGLASSAGVTLNSIGEAKKILSSGSVAAVTTTNPGPNSAGKTVEASTADTQLESWDTAISFSGNYSQVRAFLKNLEDSLLLSDLRDISIEQAQAIAEDQPSDVLNANMTVRTYVYP